MKWIIYMIVMNGLAQPVYVPTPHDTKQYVTAAACNEGAAKVEASHNELKDRLVCMKAPG